MSWPAPLGSPLVARSGPGYAAVSVTGIKIRSTLPRALVDACALVRYIRGVRS